MFFVRKRMGMGELGVSSSVLGKSKDLEKVDETREGRRALVGWFWLGWAGRASVWKWWSALNNTARTRTGKIK